VLQTTVAELVTVEEHQRKLLHAAAQPTRVELTFASSGLLHHAFCVVSWVSSAPRPRKRLQKPGLSIRRSTIIGSSLGGLLARPALSFPSAFEGTVFETYPYLLPNIVCAGVVVFGLTVGILFLEETHEDRRFERDRGCEVGRWMLNKLWRRETDYEPLSDEDGPLDETKSMLGEADSQAYRSIGSSPTLCSSRTSIAEPPEYSLEKICHRAPEVTVRDAFTKQVCLNIVAYGILAL
jgi:hypothetical protein